MDFKIGQSWILFILPVCLQQRVWNDAYNIYIKVIYSHLNSILDCDSFSKPVSVDILEYLYIYEEKKKAKMKLETY